MLIVFKRESSDAAKIAHGAVYYREFLRDEEPFEVTNEEWKKFLERTGLFEVPEGSLEPETRTLEPEAGIEG